METDHVSEPTEESFLQADPSDSEALEVTVSQRMTKAYEDDAAYARGVHGMSATEVDIMKRRIVWPKDLESQNLKRLLENRPGRPKGIVPPMDDETLDLFGNIYAESRKSNRLVEVAEQVQTADDIADILKLALYDVDDKDTQRSVFYSVLQKAYIFMGQEANPGSRTLEITSNTRRLLGATFTAVSDDKQSSAMSTIATKTIRHMEIQAAGLYGSLPRVTDKVFEDVSQEKTADPDSIRVMLTRIESSLGLLRHVAPTTARLGHVILREVVIKPASSVLKYVAASVLSEGSLDDFTANSTGISSLTREQRLRIFEGLSMNIIDSLLASYTELGGPQAKGSAILQASLKKGSRYSTSVPKRLLDVHDSILGVINAGGGMPNGEYTEEGQPVLEPIDGLPDDIRSIPELARRLMYAVRPSEETIPRDVAEFGEQSIYTLLTRIATEYEKILDE